MRIRAVARWCTRSKLYMRECRFGLGTTAHKATRACHLSLHASEMPVYAAVWLEPTSVAKCTRAIDSGLLARADCISPDLEELYALHAALCHKANISPGTFACRSTAS